MKKLVKYKCIVTVLLMVFSTYSWAQDPDLSITSMGSPYQFNGDGASNNVSIEVINIGPVFADADSQLDLTLVQTGLAFDIGTSYVFGNWTCVLNSPVLLGCTHQTTILPGSSANLTVPVVAQAGTFNFSPAIDLHVIDGASDDSDLSNNTATIDINYLPLPLPDLSTSMAFTQGYNNPFNPSDPISVDVTVANNGGDATAVSLVFDGDEFNFDFNVSHPTCTFNQNVVECHLWLLGNLKLSPLGAWFTKPLQKVLTI